MQAGYKKRIADTTVALHTSGNTANCLDLLQYFLYLSMLVIASLGKLLHPCSISPFSSKRLAPLNLQENRKSKIEIKLNYNFYKEHKY